VSFGGSTLMQINTRLQCS